MGYMIASVSSQACRTGIIEHENRSSETASLLDSLISSFDATNDHLHYLECVTREKPRFAEAVFSRFLDLPAEIRHNIFNFSFQTYVVRLYSGDQLKVEASHDAVGQRAAQRTGRRNDLASSLMSAQINSRIIFVDYRSVRTVPLFHVCRASREVATSRYGLPSPNRLLFDPTIDSIRHCGSWPYPVTPKFWHTFEIDEQHIYDFSLIKSLQLHVSGFSTRTDLCLPPDLLFNNSQVVGLVNPALNTISKSVNDLVNTLSWIETHMPQLEKLDFTISLETCDKSHATNHAELLAEKKQSIWVDLVNIRSCVVTVEETKSRKNERACMPQLNGLTIQLVPDEMSTMYTWKEGEQSQC